MISLKSAVCEFPILIWLIIGQSNKRMFEQMCSKHSKVLQNKFSENYFFFCLNPSTYSNIFPFIYVSHLLPLKRNFKKEGKKNFVKLHKPIMRNSWNNSSSSRSSNNNNNYGGNPKPHTISHQKTREITLSPQISPPYPSGIENHF